MAGGYWYEDLTGVPHGPVTVEVIRRLAYVGVLQAGSRVFEPRAEQWMMLREAPGVDPAFGPFRPPEREKPLVSAIRLPERTEHHPLVPLGVI
eukprot:gene23870-25454_t